MSIPSLNPGLSVKWFDPEDGQQKSMRNIKSELKQWSVTVKSPETLVIGEHKSLPKLCKICLLFVYLVWLFAFRF